MILRAKNKTLFESTITEQQQQNSNLNLLETDNQQVMLTSYPRRIVAELTNACNINCIMCGREHADFEPSFFDVRWFKVLEEAFTHTEEIVLHGWGEPTIHPQFERILRYLNGFPLRKYFCTNGTTLNEIHDMIFDHHVDIIAVSLDGADSHTNDLIRYGSKISDITTSLKAITNQRQKNNLDYPHVNFVFTAMKRNIDQLPDMIRLASEIGVTEVKAVYLTSFSEKMDREALYKERDRVKTIFEKTIELAKANNIMIKLPYVQGEDPAGTMVHRECFFPYRDLFIGSDGFVRPCVSTSDALFDIRQYKDFSEIWNHDSLQNYRKQVNNIENMPDGCRRCYHSTCANWNKKASFIQTGQLFSPEWKTEKSNQLRKDNTC